MTYYSPAKCPNCLASDVALRIMRAQLAAMKLKTEIGQIKAAAEPFDKRAYQRDLMRKRRAEAKKGQA